MNTPTTGAIVRSSGRHGPVHDLMTTLQTKRRVMAVVAAIAVIVAVAMTLGFFLTRPAAPHRVGSYGTGRATLTINGGSPNKLPLIAQGASLVSPGGAALSWRSADGWYLSLNGPFSFSDAAPTSEPSVTVSETSTQAVLPVDSKGTFQLDGDGFSRWSGFDSNTCAILYTEVGASGITGSIHCKGLIWYDKSSVENVQPVDVPPFDLDVDFEAAGGGVVPAANPS
jgi:hypothetical protein